MNAQVGEVGDWVFRQQTPAGAGPFPLILLIHGWTGDENSMWIFASRLPKNAMLVAPRGLFPAPLGGYGWQATLDRIWPDVADFQPAMTAFWNLLTPSNFPLANLDQVNLAGFSQGAALAYSLALAYPQKVGVFAGLSGFAPGGVDALVSSRPLTGKTCFMAHGTRDELVPVARARQARQTLLDAGAQVTYCEDDVGHKLSAACFRGLETFFARTI
jgi:phospholipase/carboxylesterase